MPWHAWTASRSSPLIPTFVRFLEPDIMHVSDFSPWRVYVYLSWFRCSHDPSWSFFAVTTTTLISTLRNLIRSVSCDSSWMSYRLLRMPVKKVRKMTDGLIWIVITL
jgi:hypothetical protein